MELVVYILLALGAYIALITRSRTIVHGCLIVYVLYSTIARSAPVTSDVLVYFNAATEWPSWNLYNLREPILWFGSSLLYTITGSVVAAFVIIDIVAGILVLWAMNLLDDGDRRMYALAPTILSSYVFVLGQQNVVRQHIALVIFLCALGIRSRSTIGSFIIFVLSLLAHNVTAILFGYWLDIGRDKRRRYGPVVSMISVVALYFAWPFIGKSSSATGLHTGHFYVMIAVVLAVMLLYANYGRLSCFDHRTIAILNFLAFFPAIFVLASAQFERVAMLFFTLMLIELYRYAGSLRIRRTDVAHLAYSAVVVPVFLFPSVLSKLY